MNIIAENKIFCRKAVTLCLEQLSYNQKFFMNYHIMLSVLKFVYLSSQFEVQENMQHFFEKAIEQNPLADLQKIYMSQVPSISKSLTLRMYNVTLTLVVWQNY